ncbi:hypothetical protein SELMODRAFT_428853 [Selaginella moellendorffii]|uniref:Uncharacterized protein n=1 Tax=Selaginella moellendorffii TaxID=88036 RepID=D8T480_SELML|nr:hypothetical protein SELMODRAFT_428853 [Selaginella moellendorffii]
MVSLLKTRLVDISSLTTNKASLKLKREDGFVVCAKCKGHSIPHKSSTITGSIISNDMMEYRVTVHDKMVDKIYNLDEGSMVKFAMESPEKIAVYLSSKPIVLLLTISRFQSTQTSNPMATTHKIATDCIAQQLEISKRTNMQETQPASESPSQMLETVYALVVLLTKELEKP